jgi:DNA-directed RNA polymerase subunit RPC12/RpoP
MASYIERGDSLYIPFKNGVSISDSQCRPRMYKSVQNFEKSFPTHNLGNKNIKLVEYKEVKHGEWMQEWEHQRLMEDYDEIPYIKCSLCGQVVWNLDKERNTTPNYCENCGAKMDGERK